jgi:hypothetical protein
LHPIEDPRDALKTQYNPLKTLLGPRTSDVGLRDLWLSESYHPTQAVVAALDSHRGSEVLVRMSGGLAQKCLMEGHAG